MAAELMTAPAQSPSNSRAPRRSAVEPTVQEIIAAARSVPAKGPAWPAWLLSGLTGLLLWASFTPLDWGPLGWIALVPLLLLVRAERRPRWLYPALYTTGLIATIAMLQWMRLGDTWMYFALAALSLYLAIYYPVFVALSRAAVHRWKMPLPVATPVIWVGLEYLRSTLMTGFGWYNLSHTQYRWIELIQISDVTGAYGVSFLIALAAACLAMLIPATWLAKLRLLPADADHRVSLGPTKPQVVSVGVCVTLFAMVLAYGYVRRGQAEFVEGPRVALIQGNFPSSLKHDPAAAQQIFNMHHKLTGMAVSPYRPDLVVWPETMYRAPLFAASPDLSDDDLTRILPQVPPSTWREAQVARALHQMSEQSGAAMILGIDTYEAAADRYRHYNSAAFVRPDRGLIGRYDKLHRVVFGEYIPLRDELPWLHALTPFPPDFGLTAGDGAAAFEYKNFRFAPIICFEDTVPHLVRQIVDGTRTKQGKPVDVLVNLTNDGWFHGSSELDQHLITAAFRAVECRTPMVRAVNTGISAVIDGDGMIVEPDVFLDGDGQGRTAMRDPKTGRWHKALNAVVIDDVPLDNRTSLYVRYGDWFAGLCCFGTLMVLLGGLIPRRLLAQ